LNANGLRGGEKARLGDSAQPQSPTQAKERLEWATRELDGAPTEVGLVDPGSGFPANTDGGLPGGGGTGHCNQKILTRFNSQFGTNAPPSSTADLGPLGHGKVTDNINIYFPSGSLPYGLVQPGRYGGGPFGTGSTLHVVSFYVGFDPTGQLSDISQVHLDQGNPLIPPFGSISHLWYVLTHSAGACP